MPIIRAQVRFQGRSELPEDQFINTFHFLGGAGDTTASLATDLTEALRRFYDVFPTGSIGSISGRMSTYVNTAVKVRFYNLDDAKPRAPLETTFTLASRASAATSLPEEVAVCCSFSSAPPITPSTRGRIYIGPLQTNAVANAADTRCMVALAFTQDLAKLCERLMVEAAAAGAPWVVYSTKNDSAATIARGHIDNAPDTQRRRGPDALARVTWPTSPA